MDIISAIKPRSRHPNGNVLITLIPLTPPSQKLFLNNAYIKKIY